MLGAVTQVQAVVETWSRHGQGIPLVVDPVMVATSGGYSTNDNTRNAAMTRSPASLRAMVNPATSAKMPAKSEKVRAARRLGPATACHKRKRTP